MPENNDFDRQLAQRLRAYEASIPDEEAPMQPRRSARSTRWTLAIGVAAAGTLAGVLLAVVLLNRPDAPVGETDATPTPSLSATPDTTPDPTSASPAPTAAPGPETREGWTPVGIGESGDTVAVNGVAEWTDGLMAYGRSATEAGGIWLSTDGQDWTPAEVPDSPPDTAVFVNGIVRSGDGYVAVGTLGHPQGSGPMGSVIWLSPDGRTWAESEGSPSVRNAPLSRLASSGDTVVAGGLASVWVSTDAGSTWTEVPAPGSDGWNISDIVVHDGRFVATGFIGSAFGPQAAAIWTSTDGATWTQVNLEGENTASAAALPDGRLLVVGETNDAVVAWISDDGETWEPIAVDGLCCIIDLAATPTGVVGVGYGVDAPSGVTLSTTDGTTWSSDAVDAALQNVIYSERFGLVGGGTDADDQPAVIFGPHPHP